MAYRTTILAEASLVGYWPLDETSGTTATDLKAARNGTYTGGFTLNQAAAGPQQTKSTQFNGSTGYVTIPTAAALHPTAALSMEAWVKPTGTGAICGAGFTSYNPPYDDYLFNVGGSFQLECYLGSGATRYNATSSIAPNGTSWYHYVLTWDGSNVRLYVNGVLASTTIATGTLNNSGMAIQIGRTLRGATAGDYYTGFISDVAIYNTVLSPPSILAHTNASSTAPAGAGRRSYHVGLPHGIAI